MPLRQSQGQGGSTIQIFAVLCSKRANVPLSLERAGHELALEANGTIVLDDEELMVEAAREGLGIAYVADWAAEAALAEGSLRKILTAWVRR